MKESFGSFSAKLVTIVCAGIVALSLSSASAATASAGTEVGGQVVVVPIALDYDPWI